ncbi:MAG: PAS domain S-box protein [Desulfobacterales bacterium]|jgi:PAS domain S-box-containing protein|nr:PAS domain S-box protein [Desulfobacterales bacterium]
MPLDSEDWKTRNVELERRLEKAQLEASYYRGIAAESGTNRLRNMFQLSRLVSRHRDIEQRLRESEERYRNVVENLNVGMLVTVDLKIVFANSAIQNLLGYGIDELLANPNPFDCIHPEDRPMVKERYLKRVKGEEVSETYAFRVLTKQGEIKWTEVTGTRINWKGHTGILNFFIDITERIHAQESRKKLEQQLSRAQKLEALGTLAGGIAHDFNNLMAAALAYVSLMQCETDPSNPHCEYLTHVQSQLRRGSQLTRQLLGYARQRPYQVKPVSLNKLVMEVSGTFGRTRKNIVVQPDLDPDLRTVNADEGQLEQALLNLFVNASDAMPEGGTLALKTRNVSHNEIASTEFQPNARPYVELQVTDTGVGMTPEIMDRIFDPFFTTKEMGRGTGLGLASVFGIVKGHGGTIDVTSQPGHGTTFTLRFPATDAAPIQPQQPKRTITPGSGVVLLVDDETMVLEASSRMLQKLGFKVFRAGSGHEAIDIFRQKAAELDLVILDIVMPGMGGEEVYRHIKQIRPEARVLVSSGYDCSGKMPETLQHDSDGFIQKPYSLSELSGKLREILNLR